MQSLTPAQRRVSIAIALAAAVVFVALGVLVHSGALFGVDRALQQLVQSERIEPLERPMQVITRLGSGYVLLPITTLACAAIAVRHRRLAGLFLASAVGA